MSGRAAPRGRGVPRRPPPWGAPRQCILDERPDILERGGVLGEAARQDLRTGRHLAGDRVDDEHHRDEALTAQNAAVLQRRLTDVTNCETVDVDVAGRYGADDPGTSVD